MVAQFILYVADQERSKTFYSNLLMMDPVLHVKGMTEFELNSHTKLGLMPENGIAAILNEKTPHPAEGSGIPRCELYIEVDKPEDYLQRALSQGAIGISRVALRDWGYFVGYCCDPDGHVLAFAKKAGTGK